MDNHQIKPSLKNVQHKTQNCFCTIIPLKVFERLLEDKEFTEQQKQYFKNVIERENSWRQFKQRENQNRVSFIGGN